MRIYVIVIIVLLLCCSPFCGPNKVYGFGYDFGRKGLRIIFIQENSSLTKVGIEPGDYILKINEVLTDSLDIEKVSNILKTTQKSILTIKNSEGDTLTKEIEKVEYDGSADTGPIWSILGYDRDDQVKDFKITKDLKNYTSFSKINSKVTLVLFWATWCKPCTSKFPAIKTLYENYRKKGLEIISISLDDDPSVPQKYVTENSLNWYHHFGEKGRESNINKKWNALLPSMALVNKDMKVISIHFTHSQLEIMLADIFKSTDFIDEVQASIISSELANKKSFELFSKKPFSKNDYIPYHKNGKWVWGGLDASRKDGYSAMVVLDKNGAQEKVEVYYSNDSQIYYKHDSK